jgi:STE24 endopeptidase
MTEPTTLIDQEKQTKAKAYARIRRRLMLVDLLWQAAYASAWLAFSWAINLRSALSAFTENSWLLVPAFAFTYSAVSSLLTLPLSYYSGFTLPHRYELSNQDLKDWIIDRLKGLAIGLPLGLFVLEIAYAILRTYPSSWWLYFAVFVIAFNILMAFLFPLLIAPIFNKYTPLGEEHKDLEQRLLHLAERAKTQVKGVYKFDMSRRTKAANAALVGIGASRRIVLGDTLINEFELDEVETILAHELGHHVNRDMSSGLAVSAALSLFGLYLANLALIWGVGYFGFASIADPAALPLLGLLAGAYGLITMPLGNAYSRWRERRADLYALQATHKNQAYASALARLANQNLADVDPEPWVEFFLYSHPSLGKRIAMAKDFRKV